MVGREVFHMKPKSQCHLSQWGEWVYGPQSWKKKRLLCESVCVQVHRWTLTLKNGRRKSFFYETKASMSFIVISRTSLQCPIMKKEKRLLWESIFSQLMDKLWFWGKRWEKRFSYQAKASTSFIVMRGLSLWCPMVKKNLDSHENQGLSHFLDESWF